MSLGRVQTPVLKMIVDRWKAAHNFKPVRRLPRTSWHCTEEQGSQGHAPRLQEPYWELHLRCRPQGSDEHLRLKYFSPEAASERIASEQEAEDVRHALGPVCTVQQLTHKRRIEKPPKLFDLTALQR